MVQNDILSIQRRFYNIFLSHSSKDKERFVNELHLWLTKTCGLKVFFDTNSIKAGQSWLDSIQEGIPKSQAFLLIHSENVSESNWVKRELDYALVHQSDYPDFKIIIIRLDDADVASGFVQSLNYISAFDGKLTPDIGYQILDALNRNEKTIPIDYGRDIYTSYGWHTHEQDYVRRIGKIFANNRFRMIGDSRNHPKFSGTDGENRIKDILYSTGGLLAVLPYRKDQTESFFTSKYIIREVEYAIEVGLPYVIFAQPGVNIPTELTERSLATIQEDSPTASQMKVASELLWNEWKTVQRPHYVFWATSFEKPHLNELVSRLVESTLGMPCLTGDRIISPDRSVQDIVIDRVRNAYVVIGDITNNNFNVLFEVGAARGANVTYHLVAGDEIRHRPIFMLRDKQIFYYKDDLDLIGLVFNVIKPYRRKILNYDF